MFIYICKLNIITLHLIQLRDEDLGSPSVALVAASHFIHPFLVLASTKSKGHFLHILFSVKINPSKHL